MNKTKNILASILIGILIIVTISSCTQPQPEIVTETIQPSQSIPTDTPTPFPTLTQSPTITPTLTLTPNFSPPLSTKMLLPSTTCPSLNQNTLFDNQNFGNNLKVNKVTDIEVAMAVAENSLLTYLNSGGTIEKLMVEFKQEQTNQNPNYLGDIQLGDVTGDGVPEIFVWLALPTSAEGLPGLLTIEYIKKFFPMPVVGTRTYVFTCQEGSYDFLGIIKDKYYNDLTAPIIVDLNSDGIDEIVQPSYDFAGSGYAIHISVLGWNESKFENLLKDELSEDWMSSFSEGSILTDVARVRSGSVSIQDIDSNGTKEVVISSDDLRGLQHCEILYRETKMVLMWNGDHFIGFYWRTPPEYRIQAVWDGDHESTHGLLDQALLSYKKVLDDNTLLPWSVSYNNLAIPLCPQIPGATPVPASVLPDENELPTLKAYSLYRIMLVNLLQNDFSSAEVNYRLIQKSYHNSYSELASAFWETYLNSKNIGVACQVAVTYAEINKDKILNPIDRNTYGNDDSLTPIYMPEDICPYK